MVKVMISKEQYLEIFRNLSEDSDIDEICEELGIKHRTIKNIMRGSMRPEIIRELTNDEYVKLDYYYSKFFLRSHIDENDLFEAYELFIKYGKIYPVNKETGIDCRRLERILSGSEYPHVFNRLETSKQNKIKIMLEERYAIV